MVAKTWLSGLSSDSGSDSAHPCDPKLLAQSFLVYINETNIEIL